MVTDVAKSTKRRVIRKKLQRNVRTEGLIALNRVSILRIYTKIEMEIREFKTSGLRFWKCIKQLVLYFFFFFIFFLPSAFRVDYTGFGWALLTMLICYVNIMFIIAVARCRKGICLCFYKFAHYSFFQELQVLVVYSRIHSNAPSFCKCNRSQKSEIRTTWIFCPALL